MRGVGLLGTMIAVAEELSGKDDDRVDATMSGESGRVQRFKRPGRHKGYQLGRDEKIGRARLGKGGDRVKQKGKKTRR